MITIRWAVAAGGLGLAGWLCGVVGAAAQPKELPAQIVTLGGTGEVHRKDTPTWTAVDLRARVDEGDSVRTQVGGRIALRTASGQVLRLGSRSQLAVLPSPPEPGPTRVRLDNGWLWVAVTPNSPAPTQVEVRAGPAVVTVLGTGVGLRRAPDGSLLVQVHHGTAVCTGPERQWERTLTGPQQLRVPASGAPGAPASITVDQLEATWVKWNTDQDTAGGYGASKPAP